MKISEIMTKNPVSVAPDDTIKTVMEVMIKHGIAGTPVTVHGRVVGIVTRRDILKYLDAEYRKQGWMIIPTPFEIIELPRVQEIPYEKISDIFKKIGDIKIKEIMQKRIYTISPTDTIEDAIQLLIKWKVNRLPVVDKDRKLLGIVTRTDLLRTLMKI